MEQRSPDPFFEQLKVDIEEGIAAADRGELLELDAVRHEAFARLEDIQRTKQ